MAVTESTMMELGVRAPDFKLPEPATGILKTLTNVRGDSATLVIFICNHCPFVIHVIDAIVGLANEYEPRGLGVVAISSNDVINYPEDAPEKMVKFADRHNFTFPYLYDESQDVARAYSAACTPDFFLFDASLACVYRGQMDGARPSNQEPKDGADLRAALDALLAGKPISERQYPSAGCGIKWKAA
jgi:peroxiredoxin